MSLDNPKTETLALKSLSRSMFWGLIISRWMIFCLHSSWRYVKPLAILRIITFYIPILVHVLVFMEDPLIEWSVTHEIVHTRNLWDFHAQNPPSLTRFTWWMFPMDSTSARNDLFTCPGPSRHFTTIFEPFSRIPLVHWSKTSFTLDGLGSVNNHSWLRLNPLEIFTMSM